ncbi:hypothetical protein Trydic_g19855 [Trypoxylus dichotomus]
MDKRSNNGGKVFLGGLKGKSLTASVPSMAIRFNATAEEIEEVFAKEEEENGTVNDSTLAEKSTDVETSPRRSILPILGKRSTSVDVNSTNVQDSSLPSDPWRFLSDIKGKITKSVEVRLTEYKARTMENEGSPKITAKDKVKDSKENSSLSDSEEASESSISRTCGVVSTTEGVEMSSDEDETPSLSEEEKQQQQQQLRKATRDDQDANSERQHTSSGASLVRRRFRVTGTDRLSSSPVKEGSLASEFLESIQKVNDDEPIESGVDALSADLNVSNFSVDSENVLNVHQVTGTDIRNAEFGADSRDLGLVFSPLGFVDLRRRSDTSEMSGRFEIAYKNKPVIVTLGCLLLYFCLPLSLYTNGFIAGALAASVVWCVYMKFSSSDPQPLRASTSYVPIIEMPSAKEYQPLKKYEGWMNEYPEEYDPLTYHVSQTQPVYLRLQGNFLKVSHTRQKIPKRAMWNEPEHKFVFTRHRIYNLLGAKVLLLPEGLARIRHWSKKYPICIVLNKDQMNFEESSPKNVKEHRGKETLVHDRKSDSIVEMQIFSKLVNNIDDPEQSIVSHTTQQSEFEDMLNADDSGDDLEWKKSCPDDDDDDYSICLEEWHDVVGPAVQISPDETRLYLFSRTCREKEDWFRRFRIAASGDPEDNRPTLQDDYLAYMKSQKIFYTDDDTAQVPDDESKQPASAADNAWMNALIARVLFDCTREQTTVQRFKERIQRKLASVRLPHFIQELYCEELNLGNSAPMILASGKPFFNDRGLWLELDISYEGLVVLILQTKVNLMKLKALHVQEAKMSSERSIDEKSAIFHSDVDDSAESSTDDEPPKTPLNNRPVLDSMGYPVPGLGGVSRGSKKFMKMVDKIAESKFFQAATENKYIKRAMQEFSNTDLRLKVEFKKCVGRLVINVPPPPSDRVWVGFRVPPELVISAQPIVGDRNISFMRVTNWIEKKIYKEFQKVFVIPNMEDLLIPVMSPKLPE